MIKFCLKSTERFFKKMLFPAFCALLFTFCSLRFAFCADAPESVKKANNLYRQGKYDEALKYYNEAEAGLPDSDVVSFDKGAALYQKGDYAQAAEAFNKALLSGNPAIEGKAAYNIGNCKFRSGRLKENTDLTSAVNLYREALDYYKRAIELNGKDTNAKYNHEFVEKELKVLLDKLKQRQKQKGGKQKQKQGQEQREAQAAAPGKKGEKQEQKRQAAAQESEGKQGRGEGKAEEQEQIKGYEPEEEAQGEMSEEEARMILERYGRQEQPGVKMKRGAGDGEYPPVLKDW